MIGAVGSLVLATSLMAVGCGGGDDDSSVPSDPVLAQGRDVYRSQCAQCHGSRGGGGSGVKLAGVVAASYPNFEDHVAVIRDGKGSGRMPAFGDRLSPEEIEAVARWEREGF
jgi:mono/diheme cytochrome c family protein